MTVILHVVKDADDLPFDGRAQRLVRARNQFRNFDTLCERIESLQKLVDESFADHSHAQAAGKIPRVQIAALDQANAIGLVVIR